MRIAAAMRKRHRTLVIVRIGIMSPGDRGGVFGAGVMEGRGRLGRHEWEGFGLSDGREVVEGEDFHMGGLAMLVYWYRERAKKFRLPRRCWGEEKVLAADEHG